MSARRNGDIELSSGALSWEIRKRLFNSSRNKSGSVKVRNNDIKPI